MALICAQLHLDEQTIAAALLHDVIEDTDTDLDELHGRVRAGDRAARRGRHQADPDQLPEPRAGGGRELPQDDRGDGAGRARDPDQARRPAAQHAHDRVPRQAEAGAEGEGDARGLRAARPPARHPRRQVGARGSLVPDPPPAQVRRDQGDGRRPPRRPRGAGRDGGGGAARTSSRRRTSPPTSSGRAKHFYSIYDKMAKKGREFNEIYDLTAMRVLDRARRRGGNARLLRRARDHPRALEADAGPLQGLHRDAEAQPLPLAAHDRDRAERHAARDPGADARDARGGRVRRRRALALQARPLRQGRRRVGRLGEDADGLAGRRPGRGRVHADAPHRPVRRRGVRLHAEGRGEDAARRRDADRLRLRRAHGRRPQDGRRQGQQPDRAAALQAEERRLRRDPHVEVGPRPVARLDVARCVLARPQQDPAVVPARDEGRDRGEGPRGARPGAEGAEPALPQAAGLGGAGAR